MPMKTSTTAIRARPVALRFHSFAVPLEQCLHLVVELDDQAAVRATRADVESRPKRRLIKPREEG